MNKTIIYTTALALSLLTVGCEKNCSYSQNYAAREKETTEHFNSAMKLYEKIDSLQFVVDSLKGKVKTYQEYKDMHRVWY